jgi:hypothetical protein
MIIIQESISPLLGESQIGCLERRMTVVCRKVCKRPLGHKGKRSSKWIANSFKIAVQLKMDFEHFTSMSLWAR